jgi:hypothetical protein
MKQDHYETLAQSLRTQTREDREEAALAHVDSILTYLLGLSLLVVLYFTVSML